MKLNGNAVKPGNVIEHNGRLWTAVKVEHVKPGKDCPDRASRHCDGTKLNERFRSSETVERVILEESGYGFLYDDGDSLVFMHGETYEQIAVAGTMVGDVAPSSTACRDRVQPRGRSDLGTAPRQGGHGSRGRRRGQGQTARRATGCSRNGVRVSCRRISRPAPESSCVPKTPAMSSAPRTDPAPARHKPEDTDPWPASPR